MEATADVDASHRVGGRPVVGAEKGEQGEVMTEHYCENCSQLEAQVEALKNDNRQLLMGLSSLIREIKEGWDQEKRIKDKMRQVDPLVSKLLNL